MTTADATEIAPRAHIWGNDISHLPVAIKTRLQNNDVNHGSSKDGQNPFVNQAEQRIYTKHDNGRDKNDSHDGAGVKRLAVEQRQTESDDQEDTKRAEQEQPSIGACDISIQNAMLKVDVCFS